MKRALSLLLILAFVFFVPSVFAQTPIPISFPASSPAVFEKIGVVAATQGTVELTTPGQAGRIAESGQPVFIGDEVRTDAQGHLQVLLLDETVFTLGPNSTIIIDEFIYDPKTRDGKMEARITKGIFRYVSGRIASKKPGNVKINLPAATIGIRGTIVAGEVSSQGSLAMLLGPGENNNAGARIGSFTMEGTAGGSAGARREVNRTGFGVQTDPAGGLSGVFQVPEASVMRLTTGLLPAPEQRPLRDRSVPQPGPAPLDQGPLPPPGTLPAPGTLPPPPPGTRLPVSSSTSLFFTERSATDLSGETTALTGENSGDITILNNFTGDLDTTLQTVAQDNATDSNFIADGISKMEELARVSQGIFHYEARGFYGGFSDGLIAKWDIHLGQGGAIGGGHSFIQVRNASFIDSIPIPFKPFEPAGPAEFTFHNLPGAVGVFTHVDITLSNRNGVVAENGKIRVDYVGDTSHASLTGHGEAASPRLPLQVPPPGP